MLFSDRSFDTVRYQLYNLNTGQLDMGQNVAKPSSFSYVSFDYIDCENDSIYCLLVNDRFGAGADYAIGTVSDDSIDVKGSLISTVNPLSNSSNTNIMVDVVNKLFIILEFTNQTTNTFVLRGISYKTGQQVYEHTITLPTGQRLKKIAYNCRYNKFYGIANKDMFQPTRLIEVDAISGNLVVRGQVSNSFTAVYPRLKSFSIGELMYYDTGYDSFSDYHLYTLNTATEEVDSIDHDPDNFIFPARSFMSYPCNSNADFSSDTTALCPGTSKQFIYTGQGAGAVHWTLSKNGSVIDTSRVLNPIFTLPSGGDYQLKLVTEGCLSSDSITKTVQAVDLPTPTFADTIRACEADTLTLPDGPGLTYTWFKDGVFYVNNRRMETNQSGTYVSQISDGNCTLSDTVYIDILQPTAFSFSDTACGTYTFNGELKTTSGQYFDTLTNAIGCDSIITLNLTILPLSYTTIDTAICQDEAPYNFNGQLKNTSGQYLDTLTAANGCDSVITLNLIVHPLPNPVVFGANRVCPGEQLVVYELMPNLHLTADWQVQGGLLVSDSVSVSSVSIDWSVSNPAAIVSAYNITDSTTGCRAADTAIQIVQINTVLYPVIINVPDSLCGTSNQQVYQTQFTTPGSQYVWGVDGGSVISQTNNSVTIDWNYPTTGSDTTFVGRIWVDESSSTNLDTCFGTSDTLSVVLAPTSLPVSLTEVICFNEPFAFGAEILDSTGIYIDSLFNQFGCDSIVTLNLTVYPISDTTITDTVCSSALPYAFGNQLLVSDGQFRDTLQNQFGCDSTITLNLRVHPAKQNDLRATICADLAPYRFGGRLLTASGQFRDTLTTSLGCDSVVILDLTINPVYDQILDTVLTNATLQLGNQLLTQSGTYRQDFTTVSGCDSSVNVNLSLIEDLFVPNIITPNSDGYNDTFIIEDLAFFAPVQLKIYNRWGRLIHEANNYENDWNGKGIPTGVYFVWLRTAQGQEYKNWLTISY